MYSNLTITCRSVPTHADGRPWTDVTQGRQYTCTPCNWMGTYFYFVDDKNVRNYISEETALKHFTGAGALLEHCKALARLAGTSTNAPSASLLTNRVQDLARQVDACYIPRYDMWQMDTDTLEKFAELIVSEMTASVKSQ